MGRVNGESREIGFGLPPAEFVSLTPPGRRWEGGETLPCGGRVSVGAVAGPGRQPEREGDVLGCGFWPERRRVGRGGERERPSAEREGFPLSFFFISILYFPKLFQNSFEFF